MLFFLILQLFRCTWNTNEEVPERGGLHKNETIFFHGIDNLGVKRKGGKEQPKCVDDFMIMKYLNIYVIRKLKLKGNTRCLPAKHS